VNYEEDLKNWQEEKEMLGNENSLIKAENQQLLSELEKLKKANVNNYAQKKQINNDKLIYVRKIKKFIVHFILGK
jgi:hypothetical protein